MNSLPHPRPQSERSVCILHVTSCWLERLEIFVVIDTRTPYLVSCHAPTGELGRLSPYSMSVESRQKIQEAVDGLASAKEIELPVRWCCPYGSAADLQDAIKHGAPLDERHFAVGDPASIDPAMRSALREFASHRTAVARRSSHPSVQVSRVRIKAA